MLESQEWFCSFKNQPTSNQYTVKKMAVLFFRIYFTLTQRYSSSSSGLKINIQILLSLSNSDHNLQQPDCVKHALWVPDKNLNIQLQKSIGNYWGKAPYNKIVALLCPRLQGHSFWKQSFSIYLPLIQLQFSLQRSYFSESMQM